MSGANYFSCEKYKKQRESGASSAINPGGGDYKEAKTSQRKAELRAFFFKRVPARSEEDSLFVTCRKLE